MKGYRFLGVRGNWSARRKPTKAGMESANQIYVQPLASCIGERKVFEHKPTRLATGVVCHPDTEQNRPYKIPWPCRGLNQGPTALQARTLPVCYTTPLSELLWNELWKINMGKVKDSVTQDTAEFMHWITRPGITHSQQIYDLEAFFFFFNEIHSKCW